MPRTDQSSLITRSRHPTGASELCRPPRREVVRSGATSCVSAGLPGQGAEGIRKAKAGEVVDHADQSSEHALGDVADARTSKREWLVTVWASHGMAVTRAIGLQPTGGPITCTDRPLRSGDGYLLAIGGPAPIDGYAAVNVTVSTVGGSTMARKSSRPSQPNAAATRSMSTPGFGGVWPQRSTRTVGTRRRAARRARNAEEGRTPESSAPLARREAPVDPTAQGVSRYGALEMAGVARLRLASGRDIARAL